MACSVAVIVLFAVVAQNCAVPFHLATPARATRSASHTIPTRSAAPRPVHSPRPLRAESGKGALPGLEDMLKDPKYKDRAEAVQKAMEDPGMQKQMMQAASMANSPEMLKKMAELKDDPDMKPMFEAMEQGLKEGGPEKAMEAVMKFYKDPDFVAKVGEKMGDTPAKLQAAASSKPVLPEELQKAMQDPEMRKQMEAAKAMAQTPEMQEKMKELRNDPELKEYFDEMAKGGPEAVAKYYNNPKILEKIAEKLGDMPQQAFQKVAGASESPSAVEPPPVNSLLDAARYGDVEAVEDYIAVGKDLNAADNEKRTPLHMASGAGYEPIVAELIKAGAALEVIDSKGNTPLHYAAGYGRVGITKALIDAGANVFAENDNGKTPGDVLKLNKDNPILKETEIMSKIAPAVLMSAEAVPSVSAQVLIGVFVGGGVILAALVRSRRGAAAATPAVESLLHA